MRLARGYLRSKPGRTSALAGGIAAVAAAFTVLGLKAAALTGLDLRSITLSVLVLLAGAIFLVNGATAALSARRRDLTTLRALGWRRRHLARQLLREFALIAAAAGLLAVLAAYMFEGALTSRTASGWPLLAMPGAVAVTLAAAWWPVRRATAEGRLTASPGARRPAAEPRRQLRVIDQAIRDLWRAPKRATLGALVIAVACAPLGLELALRWAFGGVLAGSWLGSAISWQTDTIDVPALMVILAMATITVADIDWLRAGDRTAELRTLRAIGWPACGVARLVAWEAVLLGAGGGAAATVADMAGSLVILHRLPAGLLALTALVVGTGVLVSLVAAGLSAAVGRRRGTRVAR